MVCHSTSLFFLSTVFYGFQCTNLPVPNEPFPLPCLGPLESGIGKMGSWREWMFFPPLCTYSLVTCSTGAVGHALHLCPQMSPLLGLFFESECSLYHWNVHKHSPNAWPGFKRPMYTYMWMILSGHQIIWSKQTNKPEQAISCLFLVFEALRTELSSVVATS